MIYKIQILLKAENDIKKAFVWYEDKQVGLGGRFLDEIGEIFNYIEDNPKLFQIRRSSKFREAVLVKFPFAVIYEIIEYRVVVYAVFATKQNPDKKLL